MKPGQNNKDTAKNSNRHPFFTTTKDSSTVASMRYTLFLCKDEPISLPTQSPVK